jgi:alkyl hydroperoxide reductase subunit AhpC
VSPNPPGISNDFASTTDYMSLINTQVQPFKTEAFHNGKFITVTEESLKGKWSVLIFMPAAFTFNCPTEDRRRC